MTYISVIIVIKRVTERGNTELKKKIYILSLMMVALLLASCFGKGNVTSKPPVIKNDDASTESQTGIGIVVPDLCDKAFDSTLQQKLSNDGYILSVISEYHDTVPMGVIIAQLPMAGTAIQEKGIKLEIRVSAGKNPASDKDDTTDKSSGKPALPQTPPDKSESIARPHDITTPKGKGLTVPKWVVSPKIDYDIIETFGMTGYSICRKWDNYGIIDMNGKPFGTGAYTKLYFCPEHGLSSPDVTKKTKLAEDLFIVPDCGLEDLESDRNIYVFDDSRNRVYLTGYTDGRFKIADITETEYFKTNSNYIAVLYNCDTDLMMYEDAGMESLSDIFTAENRKMKYGVVNNEFITVVEFAYDEIRPGNDCYIVKQNGKYGYRGLSGQYYYECIFEEANTAYLGTAWVRYNGKWGTAAF